MLGGHLKLKHLEVQMRFHQIGQPKLFTSTLAFRIGQHPLVKIELKKKLSFKGVKHNKNEKFFFRGECYCIIFDMTSVTP